MRACPRLTVALRSLVALAATLASARAHAVSASPCADGELAGALMNLFDGSDVGVRRAAADTLARCHAAGTEGALARVARTDVDPDVRRAAARGLAPIDSPASRAALSALARESRDAVVRTEAEEALVDAHDRDGLWAIVEDGAVSTPERVRALDHLGPPTSDGEQARLKALVSGTPAPLASAAVASLDRAKKAATKPVDKREELRLAPPPRGFAVDTPAVLGPPKPAPAPPAETPAFTPALVQPLIERPSDGLPLAVGASAAAGGALFPLLSLMSGLDSPGALVLTGSAGAVIGAGTTWGLSRFGFRPTLPQAAWYATATTWGTLAGATISASAGFQGPRARYGTIVLGEVVGLSAGIWTSKAVPWTGAQVVTANSFVLGAGLVALGVDRLRPSSGGPGPLAGVVVVPWMIGSAVAAHEIAPTSNDLHLMFVSALAGSWTGGLLASGERATPLWHSRAGAGGFALGAGGGYLLAAGAAAFSDVDPSRTWASGLMLTLGNVAGRGIEMMGRPSSPERWNLGTGLGGAAFALGTFVYQPYAKFGPSAPSMGVTGLLVPPSIAFAAYAARDGFSAHGPAREQRNGAVQATAVLGVVTGALASRAFSPDAGDELTTTVFTGLGASAGLGVAKLAVDQRGTADAVGVVAGAGVGFVGGAVFSHFTRLRAPEVGAGFVGAGYGAIAGTLALTLREPTWKGTRRDGAGLALGVPAGALVGGALAGALDARGENVTVTMVAGFFGLGTGAGVGFMLPGGAGDSRNLRASLLAGTGAFLAASMLLEPKLHLADGLGDGAAPLFLEGALAGGGWGLMAGRLVDSSANGRHVRGGGLAGVSLGGATGLVLSTLVEPRAQAYWLTLGAGTYGALGGLGVADLAFASGGRHDTSAALAGSTVAFVGAAAASRALDLDHVDAHASYVGAPFGAVVGALSLSLVSTPVGRDRSRQIGGGALLGTSVGGLGAIALRQATQASDRAVGLTALGGLDGLGAGFGLGLLIDENDSRPARIASTVGAVTGLAIGGALWPRLQLDEGDHALVVGVGAAAGWAGLWLPALGAAHWDDVSRSRMAGGVIAGVGLGTLGATALVPALAIEPDLVENALWMDAVFSSAGLGAGVLASARPDRQAMTLLSAGTLGLVLGGALHEQINLDADAAPWVTLGAVEGAWLGAWLPYAVRPRANVTVGQKWAGLTAGTLGLAGAAALSSSGVHLTAGDTTMGLTGSAIGSSLAGGVALLSDSVHGPGSAGLVLAGSVVGTVGGLALSPHMDFEGRAIPYTLMGATLGASEASLFAWASRGATNDQYGGAALIGAGTGATLGLVAASHPFLTAPTALASSGFAAWGAWIGAFAGAAADPRAPRISGIGMAGADAGFLAGYGLLKLDLIEPRDFGWLSLGGAMGTVAGGLAGAVFTKPSDRAPLWIGLSAGPVAGMIAGAIALPALRKLHPVAYAAPRPSSRAHRDARAAADGGDGSDDAPLTRPTRWNQVVAVEQCAPFFGALPTTPDSPVPPPVLLGVTGLWR